MMMYQGYASGFDILGARIWFWCTGVRIWFWYTGGHASGFDAQGYASGFDILGARVWFWFTWGTHLVLMHRGYASGFDVQGVRICLFLLLIRTWFWCVGNTHAVLIYCHQTVHDTFTHCWVIISEGGLTLNKYWITSSFAKPNRQWYLIWKLVKELLFFG